MYPYYTQQSGINWVQGESGAKSFYVPAGQTALLMDSEEQRFFLKTVDASGMPMPLRTFNYSEQEAQIQAVATTDRDSLFKELNAKIDALTKRIDAMEGAKHESVI